MRYVLSRLDYPDKNQDVIGEPDPKIIGLVGTIYYGERNKVG